jgi:serine/threonine protein kinase
MLNSLPAYRGGYGMEGRLAESGSGKVYRARNTAGSILAIRVLEGPLARDPELPDRLRAEAELKHDNILSLLDLFQNSERVGIVTELLEGKTLRELIAEDQSLSLEGRVEIMTRVGEALRLANANGVAHRGLKPSRIHVLPDGTVKVRSFSVDLLGSDMRYLAPEQFLGQPVDALCNMYTYGAVLDELTANEAHPTLLTSILERAQTQDRQSRYENFDALLADVARLLLQLRKTDLHFSGLFETVPLSGQDPTQAVTPRENVQFTVHSPQVVRPGEWKTLLGTLDSTIDSTMPIPLEGELTFVPQMNGVEFNPGRVSCMWQESVHQASFRMRASPVVDGQTVRGQMFVYLGSIMVAQVALRIEVNSQRNFDATEEALTPVTVPRYRRIFASYSQRDAGIVEELERYSQAMGDEYVRDVMRLRSGEVWNDRLMQMIAQAEVFQLFWSSDSIRSPFVRQEWQYGLGLNRDSFVRPVYWEEPLPELAALNLPPGELRDLHFHRVPAPRAVHVPVAVAAVATAAATPAGPPPLPPPVRSPASPVWTPPQVPPMPASYVPPPPVDEPEPRRLGLQWAAALILVFGIGGLSWYALQSRKSAPEPTPVTTTPPVADPGPARASAPDLPTAATAQPPATKPRPVAPQFTVTVWSRGARIRPAQAIHGVDPFLQVSFGLDGKVSSDASLRVDWFVNDVLAGKTEFEPSEKGRRKGPLSEPPEGDYRAVLMVDGDEAASVRFSYRK